MADSTGAWYVVVTVSRQEDLAVRSLGEAGFACYAPMLRKDVIHARSKRIVRKTFRLFSGYLFVWVRTGQAWADVRAAKAVRGYLSDGDRRPMVVPCREIMRLSKAELAGEFDFTLPNKPSRARREEMMRKRFRPGSRIRVAHGSFAGFYGLVETATATGHVRATLDLFGRSTVVDFPASDLDEDAA